MIDMKILGLTLDADNNAPILVLQQDGGTEILPIWIGTPEALSISVVLNNNKLDRPVTHETMLRAIEAVGGTVNAVDIVAVRNGTYYSELEMTGCDGNIRRLDCRPSDGIAVAVRCNAPIRVSPQVLAETASTRAKHRGEDLVTSFNLEQATDTIPANMLRLMEPPSRYKM